MQNEFLNDIFWSGVIKLQKVKNKGGMWDFLKFKGTKWYYYKPQGRFLKLSLIIMCGDLIAQVRISLQNKLTKIN